MRRVHGRKNICLTTSNKYQFKDWYFSQLIKKKEMIKFIVFLG
jgi:hypothetical protein